MTEAVEINRILVPLDGSELAEQAIPYAIALAGNDAGIVFIHVLSEVRPVRDLIGRVKAESDEVAIDEIASATAELKAAAARWPALNADKVQYIVRIGDYATEILSAADEHECDLIIAASRGRGAVGRLTFGSVADRLSRSTTKPIMIIRPSDAASEASTTQIRRIVVPYDGSELAAGAFPVAISLARRLAADVMLIHAVNPTALAPMAGPMEPYYSAEIYDQLLTDLRTQAQTELEAAQAEFKSAGVSANYEIVAGSPYAVIAERTDDDDLIVMTSHGRSGIRRWLIGSVAEKLVREGPVPVVLVPSSGRGDAS